MMRKREFLNFKPSVQAAAAFALAVNLATSPNAKKLSLVSLPRSFVGPVAAGDPLQFWGSQVSELS